MSGVEPPGAQDSLKPIAPRSMQRPSIQMGAGGLPSAAEIWSTGAEAQAHPGKPANPNKAAEHIATEKLLYGPEPAEASKLGSIWQNSAWQKRSLARSRSRPPRRLSLAKAAAHSAHLPGVFWIGFWNNRIVRSMLSAAQARARSTACCSRLVSSRAAEKARGHDCDDFGGGSRKRHRSAP